VEALSLPADNEGPDSGTSISPFLLRSTFWTVVSIALAVACTLLGVVYAQSSQHADMEYHPAAETMMLKYLQPLSEVVVGNTKTLEHMATSLESIETQLASRDERIAEFYRLYGQSLERLRTQDLALPTD